MSDHCDLLWLQRGSSWKAKQYFLPGTGRISIFSKAYCCGRQNRILCLSQDRWALWERACAEDSSSPKTARVMGGMGYGSVPGASAGASSMLQGSCSKKLSRSSSSLSGRVRIKRSLSGGTRGL